jgi:hypothetical protein
VLVQGPNPLVEVLAMPGMEKDAHSEDPELRQSEFDSACDEVESGSLVEARRCIAIS